MDTTWLDADRKDLIAHFHAPVQVASYEFSTGGDHSADLHSGRIPVNWEFKARVADKYGLTFLATGCCNVFTEPNEIVTNHWGGITDAQVFSDMYGYCTRVKDETASVFDIAKCGCATKLPGQCVEQTQFT